MYEGVYNEAYEVLRKVSASTAFRASGLALNHWKYINKLLGKYNAIKNEDQKRTVYKLYNYGFISGFVDAVTDEQNNSEERWEAVSEEFRVGSKHHYMFISAYEHGHKHGKEYNAIPNTKSA